MKKECLICNETFEALNGAKRKAGLSYGQYSAIRRGLLKV